MFSNRLHFHIQIIRASKNIVPEVKIYADVQMK